MTRREKAGELHDQLRNCAQAVALAFADLVDLDEKTLKAATTGFGGGGGDMNGTCGAVNACYLISSLLYNSSGDPAGRGKTMKLNRRVSEEFRKKAQSLICREIKGIDTGKVLLPCHDCVMNAAEILEKQLKESGDIK